MKEITFITLLLVTSLTIGGQSCGFDGIRKKQLQDPNFALKIQDAETKLQQKIASKSAFEKTSTTLLYIPIVVHVIHLGESVGTGSNISDAQIQSSIDNLNDFYRGLTAGSPVDFEIEFTLAKRDPSCNATSGINRINGSGLTGYADFGVNFENSNGADDAAVKALSKWPETDYFNIWIVTEIDGNNGGSGIQGYANFYNGFNDEGAVMMASVFGYDPGNTNGWGLNSNGDNSTVIHEVGHYFHLYHTFIGDDPDNDGSGDDCPLDNTVGTDSDGCADTVPHKRETSTCPSINSCTTAAWVDDNTINNIMSYYRCTDKLTPDQKTRVRAAMEGTSIVSSAGVLDPDPTYVAPTTACTTNTVTTNNAGIRAVSLNGKTFESFTSQFDGGNIDKSGSCTNYFEITSSNAYNLNVTVINANFHQLGVWIDWNDDGDFNDESEQQYLEQDIPANTTVSIPITYPTNIPSDDYVRIRVINDLDDRYGNGIINSPCYQSLIHGQSEDYAIYVKQNGALTVNSNHLEDILIYSNPVEDKILIKGTVFNETKAELFDIHGRLLVDKKLNPTLTENFIPTPKFSTGIYIVKLKNGIQTKTQKLVLN